MRSAWLKKALVILLPVFCTAIYAQTNPHTQIRWPPNCGTDGTMVYNYTNNTCIPAVIGPTIDPTTIINWPANCHAPGMVYNLQLNSCINMNAIDPGSQINWPANCAAQGMVYSQQANGCIAVVAGPKVDPSTQITWASNCNANNFMTYNFAQNTCFDVRSNITAGTTTTLAPGASATVTQTGTFPNFVLNFGIPAGIPGGSLSYPGCNTDGSNGFTCTGKFTGSGVSNSTGYTQNGFNQLTVSQDEYVKGPQFKVNGNIPKQLLTRLMQASHRVVRVGYYGTSIETFLDSFGYNFVKSLQGVYGAASSNYSYAPGDGGGFAFYSGPAPNGWGEQGFLGAHYLRLKGVFGVVPTGGTVSAGPITHYFKASSTCVVYDQEPDGAAAMPVTIDGASVAAINFLSAASIYRQASCYSGYDPKVVHTLVITPSATQTTGYIEGVEDGSASGWADKGIEIMPNAQPSSTLSNFFTCCYGGLAGPNFGGAAPTTNANAGYLSIFKANSAVDPDFVIFGGPTNDTLQNNVNFVSQLNTFVNTSVAQGVPMILLIEPAACAGTSGTTTYALTAGCGSGTNNGTVVWATQKAAMLAACAANPDWLYCADEDDYTGFEYANALFHTSPITSNTHPFDMGNGNTQIAFANKVAAEFGLPPMTGGFNQQPAFTGSGLGASPVVGPIEPCAALNTIWEDTSNGTGAAAQVKIKVANLNYGYSPMVGGIATNGGQTSGTNFVNPGCSKGVWRVVQGYAANVAKPMSDTTVTGGPNANVSYSTYPDGEPYVKVASTTANAGWAYSMFPGDQAAFSVGKTYTVSFKYKVDALSATGVASYCASRNYNGSTYVYLNPVSGAYDSTGNTFPLYIPTALPAVAGAVQPDYDTDYHRVAFTYTQAAGWTQSFQVYCFINQNSAIEFSDVRIDLGASIAYRNDIEPQLTAAGAGSVLVNTPTAAVEPPNTATYEHIYWTDTSSTVGNVTKRLKAVGGVYAADGLGPTTMRGIWDVIGGQNITFANLQSLQTCSNFSISGTLTPNFNFTPITGSGLQGTGCQDVVATSSNGFLINDFRPTTGVNTQAADTYTLSFLYQQTTPNPALPPSKPSFAIRLYNGGTIYYLQADKSWNTTSYTGWPIPWVYPSDTGYKRVAITFNGNGSLAPSATNYMRVDVYPGLSGTLAGTTFMVGDFQLVRGASVVENPAQWTQLYSAAGIPLPACAVATKGQSLTVSDATAPTYMGAYTSGGGITAAVICSYNGTTYSWLTH